MISRENIHIVHLSENFLVFEYKNKYNFYIKGNVFSIVFISEYSSEIKLQIELQDKKSYVLYQYIMNLNQIISDIFLVIMFVPNILEEKISILIKELENKLEEINEDCTY